MEKLITQAARLLENGGVVSLPTETVYSLSANACNDQAIERIYQLKGRRKDNPLSLLIGNIRNAYDIVTINKHAEILMEAFFPGSLTLVLPKRKNNKISKFVNENLATLAVRMPSHALALEILNAVIFPIVGTSANPSGFPSAVDAKTVVKYFSNNVDLIVDGGVCDVGVASTILDLSSAIPKILRQGTITAMQIEEKIGCRINFAV